MNIDNDRKHSGIHAKNNDNILVKVKIRKPKTTRRRTGENNTAICTATVYEYVDNVKT